MAGSQPASGNGDPSPNSHADAEAPNADTCAGTCDGYAYSSSALGDAYRDANAYSDRCADGDSHFYANAHSDLDANACSSNGNSVPHPDAAANGGGGGGQGYAGD